MATGTVTETRLFNPAPPIGGTNRIALAWTSDASGVVSGTASARIAGTIVKVEFIPGTSGTQPTDGYDVTLTDTASIDVLGGQGGNLSNSAASSVVPGVPLKDGTTTSTMLCVTADPLTLVIANAGNAKSGQVILYVRS